MSHQQNNLDCDYLENISTSDCLPTVYRWALLGLLVAFFIGGFLSLFGSLHQRVGAVDLLQYWSAVQLLAHHGNPYDTVQLATLEQSVWNASIRGDLALPVVMYNPPLIFSFIFILKWFSFEAFRSWWCIGIVLAIALSVLLLVRARAVSVASRQHLYSMAAVLVSFPPLYALMFYGQLSHLLLFGFSAAVFFAIRQPDSVLNSFWAGAMLSITLVKPHILWFVYLILLMQSLRLRAFKMLYGFIAGAVVLTAVPLVLYPDLLGQYLNFLGSPPVLWRTATVGSWLQYFLGQHQMWVKLLPTALFFPNCAFCISKEFLSGRYSAELMWLFPLSLVFAPYGWVYDQIVMLPLVLWLVSSTTKQRVIYVAIGLLVLNMVDFFLTLNWGQEFGLFYPVGISALVLIQSARAKEPFLGSQPILG